MSDDTIRLVTIGRILRRRWRLLAVLTLVGALVGYGVSLLFPPRYTTSASVLLPGAWEERALLTQTEIATSSVVVDRAAATLHWDGVDGRDLRDRVSAQAADGNIVRISGTAESPERAQQLSDQVAQQFVGYAAQVVGDNGDPEAAAQLAALRQMVAQTSSRITELADAADPGKTVESVQARTDLEKLRTTLQEAMNKLEEADPAAVKAGLVVMGPAPRPTGEAPPTRWQLIAGGALLFFLVALIGHLTAARMSRRPRTEPEIAEALGSASLGTVDVPAERRRTGRRCAVRGPGRAGCWTWTSGGMCPPRRRPATRRAGRCATGGCAPACGSGCRRRGGCWPSSRRATAAPCGPPGSWWPPPGATRGCGWSRSGWTGRWCRTGTPSRVR